MQHSQHVFLPLRRGHGSVTYEVGAEEEIEISVYTRSQAGAKFTITDVAHSHAPWVENFEVKHSGPDDPDSQPTHMVITKEKISGPIHLKVKADSNAGRWSTHNYVIAFSVYRK